MDFNRIELLLNKYWEGETSLQEEAELKAYFRNSSEIPEQWKETAALFRYYDESKKNAIIDDSFDKALVGKIAMPKRKHVKFIFNSMRIAAGVAVLCISIWLVREEIRKTDPPQVEDTYDDPRLAFEETKKALMMISKSFGTAEKQAQKINLFNKAQEEIQKSEKDQNL